MTKNDICLLCGANDVHECGEDFLCNRCCLNIMSIPDKFEWLSDWLENDVIPYAIKMKYKKELL